MLIKRISIAAAIAALGVAAACSGGGNNPTPVYPVPGGNVTGQPFTFTPVGGYSGTVSIGGCTGASPAPLVVTLSTSDPAGAGPFSSPPVPQVFAIVTAGTGGATLCSLATLQITLPAAVPAGQSLYLAHYDGTTWQPVFKAATLISGTTYQIAGGILNPSIVLAAGQSAYFVLYESTIQIGPTPTPTPVPTATPTGAPSNVIANGNFETGSLSPWVACSYKHTPTGYAAAINPSPAPAATATQAPDSTGSPSPVLAGSDLAPFVSVTAPPRNWNPNNLTPPAVGMGSHAALTGSLSAMINGTTGICQTVTVPTSGILSFWVYEGGTAYNFYNGDQEAQILDSTGTTVKQTLFVELNCYYDPTNLGEPAYPTSGCFPPAYGGTSAYVDWQGGFWTERGPYDLSSLAGQTVTLFLGTWSNQTHVPAPVSYANFMFVDNVSLESGVPPTAAPTASPTPMATISATIQGGTHR